MSGRAARWLLSLAAGRWSPRSGPPRLTIVRHHRVYADGERALYHLGVSEAILRAQLETCVRAGAVPCTVRDGLARIARGDAGHAVAFSFDDGYADNVTRALPLLERFGAKASFYLAAGLMETRTAPWWDELAFVLEHAGRPVATVECGGAALALDVATSAGRRAALRALLPPLRVPPAEQRARLDAVREALAARGSAPCELAEWPLARRLAEAGMEIGAHTMTHPFLTLLPADEQHREIAESTALAAERTGAAVTGLAYPVGDHDARTIDAARATGLAYAVTTQSGDCAPGAPPFRLPRRALTEGGSVGPDGRVSARMVRAELQGAFDGLRGRQPAGPDAGGPAPGARRVRLLYVAGNFTTGGAERHLLEMWRRLDRGRFDVRIAVLKREGGFAPLVEAIGLPIHDLRVGRRLYDLSGLMGLLRLVSLVREFRPDVIHGYLFGPNLFAALAGRLCRVPVVCVAKRNMDAFETRRQIAVQRLAHRLATHVTAVSREVATSSVALGIPAGRVTVIENGVDVTRFDGATRHGALPGLAPSSPGVPLIGSVGCLAPRKDYGTLLAALAHLSAKHDFRCVIAGDGPDRAALEARAAELGVAGRLTFLGERSDVDRLLPAFDLFTLSSREEGIPNALLEAMAAARPCVVTRVGGNAEVLADGRTGWLVPARDPLALAAAFDEVLSNPAEAARRGAAARQAVIEERSIGAMVRRHEAFYLRALGRDATPAGGSAA